MCVTLPRLRCLELDDEDEDEAEDAPTREHVFVFAPPRCGPLRVGIYFGRLDGWGNELIQCMIVDLAYQPADRILERGEVIVVPADNVGLLRVIESSGMFRRSEGRDQ